MDEVYQITVKKISKETYKGKEQFLFRFEDGMSPDDFDDFAIALRDYLKKNTSVDL